MRNPEVSTIAYPAMIICFAFLNSCQTINYTASYELASKNNGFSKADAVNSIRSLAKKHKLRAQVESNISDTLNLYGKPYHQFRVVIQQTAFQTGKINLQYWGGPTSKNAYRKFLNNLTDSIQANYKLISKEISETK